MAWRSERWTLANFLPVGFVIWVISTVWVLYGWLHLLPLLQLGQVHEDRDNAMFQRGVAETAVSQVLVFLLLACFIRAVVTDPGFVPVHTPFACYELKRNGDRRFCKWCDDYKPDRCHHCRMCGSCVLRMDHHCPWIVNCVGFRNHKYFFLLVFYALLNLGFITLTMSESVSRALTTETPSMHRFLLVFCMTLASLMALPLQVFFVFHIWLMLNAYTTIEFCELRLSESDPRFRAVPPNYSRGVYEDLKAVLGPVPLLWLLPVMPPCGDGLHFPPTANRAAG